MSEYLTCKVCGAIINKETESASIPEDSNAFKIQTVKKENAELKQKVITLEISLEEKQELSNPPGDENGKDKRDDW